MASLNSSRTLGEVQDGAAMQPKKAATRKITKLAKEAEELAKRKADMMAPENSSSLRRSVIPPAIPSLSVQVDDLDQNSESDQMRPFPPSNPLSYAKAAEAAREAVVSSRKAPLNRLEPEEEEVI
jgi:hypothetical protein